MPSVPVAIDIVVIDDDHSEDGGIATIDSWPLSAWLAPVDLPS